MSTLTFRFGSSGWFALLAQSLREQMPRPQGDERHSLSEEFSDPPRELLLPGQSTLGWHFILDRSGLQFHQEPLATADRVVVLDYRTALPLVRLHFDEATQGQRRALTQAAFKTGKLRFREQRPLPAWIGETMDAVHNRMAARTLAEEG